MKKIIVLGASGSFGFKLLKALKDSNEYKVIAVSIYKNLDKLNEILQDFPSIEYVGISSGEHFKFSRKIEYFKGENANVELIDNVDADIIFNCIYGVKGYEPFIYALNKGKKIINTNREIYMINPSLLNDINNVVSLEQFNQIISQIDTDKYDHINIYFNGGALKNYPLDKLSKAYNKTLFKLKEDDEGNRNALDNASGLTLFKVVLQLSLITGLDFKNIGIKISNDGNNYLGINNEVYTLSNPYSYVLYNEKTIEKVKDVEFSNIDFNRYPMFLFLSRNYAKYGRRVLVAANAANEVAVGQFLTEKITFGEFETVIRRVVLDVIKNKKNSKDEEEIKEISEYSKKKAKALSDFLFNASQEGFNVKKLKKNQKIKSVKENKEKEELLDKKRRKKMSRWKNDPSKKELWEEHQNKKRKKSKQKLKKVNPNVKVEIISSNDFKVEINSKDIKNRMNDQQHSYKKNIK